MIIYIIYLHCFFKKLKGMIINKNQFDICILIILCQKKKKKKKKKKKN